MRGRKGRQKVEELKTSRGLLGGKGMAAVSTLHLANDRCASKWQSAHFCTRIMWVLCISYQLLRRREDTNAAAAALVIITIRIKISEQLALFTKCLAPEAEEISVWGLKMNAISSHAELRLGEGVENHWCYSFYFETDKKKKRKVPQTDRPLPGKPEALGSVLKRG